MQFVLGVLLFTSLFSCKPKLIYSERVRVDTLIVTKKEIITKPMTTFIEVDKPCDSLGRLIPIHFTTTSGNNRVTLNNINGKLQLSSQIDSSKVSVSDTFQSKTDYKEIIKERKVIPKWVWYSLAGNFIIIFFYLRKFLTFF